MTPVVRVPASTSNLGAGFDCLGLALDLWLEARLVPGRGTRYRGTLSGFDAQDDVIYRHLRDLGALNGFRLEIESDIPVGKGLGSSAAAIVAALALGRLADGAELVPEEIYRAAVSAERHPDNAGPAVYGGLILAAARPTPLALSPEIGVALAIPEKGVSTKVARDLVPNAFPRDVAIHQAARAAALVTGLASGNPEMIGFGMEDRLAVPHRKRLIDGYDDAVARGKAAGAFGVTISGAGSALLALGPANAVGPIAQEMADALTAAQNPASAATPSISNAGLHRPPTA